ncbi:MAG: hypothetical protein DLM50_03530 [Candidatus Meridianibacter frigidus]|nr:MAG: hypothetical protein DLM50_03530 [Candidatus Eremiobacteraeota bacterium]
MKRGPNITLAALFMLAACGGSAQKSAQQAASAAPGEAKDALIAATVKTKVSAVDLDATTAVRVDVSDGRVVLTGEAKNEEQRREFENSARSVDGVKGVDDRTRINPHLRGAKETLSDAALTARVAGALAAETGINALAIKPTVHDGVVTLDGHVRSIATKQTMLQTVRGVGGVRSVVDRIAAP